MSRLKVVTWNAEGMFVTGSKTRRGTPHDAVAVIKKLDADIVAVPEFGVSGQLSEEIRLSLHALGYQIVETAYEDGPGSMYGMAVLSRLPIVSSRIVRLADLRNVIELKVVDVHGQQLYVLAVHLDDRTEDARLQQIEHVVTLVSAHRSTPCLLMGDFNAMAHGSYFAKAARSKLGRKLAVTLPHDKLRSMATRVNEMALGTTIDYLTKHSHLHDLDPGRKRTISARQQGVEWLPHLRLAKIDWIFGSKEFTTKHYRVMRDVGSDHRPVSAELTY